MKLFKIIYFGMTIIKLRKVLDVINQFSIFQSKEFILSVHFILKTTWLFTIGRNLFLFF